MTEAGTEVVDWEEQPLLSISQNQLLKLILLGKKPYKKMKKQT